MPSNQKFFGWEDLCASGFRILANVDFKQFDQFLTDSVRRYYVDKGINFTSPYKPDDNGNEYFVLGNFTFHSTSQYQVIQKLKGFDIFDILEELLHIKEPGKFFDTMNGTIRCFLFSQKDKQTRQILFVSFHFLKSEIQLVGKYLDQAGIYRYWLLVENWQRLYKDFLKGNEKGVSFGNKEYFPIPLYSHTQMTFYILICGLLFAGIVLTCEIVNLGNIYEVKQAGKKVIANGISLIFKCNTAIVTAILYYYKKILNGIRNLIYPLRKCCRRKT